MKWFFVVLRKFSQQWCWLSLGTGLGLLCALAAVGLLALSGWLISSAAFAGLAITSAAAFNYLIPAAAIRGLALIRILSRYGERVISHQATFKLLRDLRVWVYQNLEPLAPSILWQYQSGDLLNRFVGDIDVLNHFYLRFLSPVINAALLVIVLSLGLSLINITLAMLVCSVMAIAVISVCTLSYWVGCPSAQILAKQQQLIREYLVNQLQHLTQLSLYQAQTAFNSRFTKIHQSWFQAQARLAYWQAVSLFLMHLLCGFTVVVALYYMIPLVSQHLISGPLLALVVLVIVGAYEVLVPLPQAFQKLGQTKQSSKRVRQLLEIKPLVEFIECTTDLARDKDIKFERVSFCYPGSSQWILKNFNLTVASGQHLVITGPIGVGKSTLLQLLTRCYDPTAGSIRIGGVDIRQLSESTLRQTICLAMQHTHIFNDTLKANLLVANPSAIDSQLWQALATVQLNDFVAALPNGLETELGEFGCRLSGGQIRRMGLARTVLSTAPIILWDEPSEGIDAQTFHEIWTTLTNLWPHKTLIVVSHQLTFFDAEVRKLMSLK